MKRSMVLPFKESIISYTPNMDHFLSVLENQHEVTYPWILENYIDLIIRKDGQNPSVFEFLDYNKIWWTCPFIHVSRIERQAFAVYGGAACRTGARGLDGLSAEQLFAVRADAERSERVAELPPGG